MEWMCCWLQDIVCTTGAHTLQSLRCLRPGSSSTPQQHLQLVSAALLHRQQRRCSWRKLPQWQQPLPTTVLGRRCSHSSSSTTTTTTYRRIADNLVATAWRCLSRHGAHQRCLQDTLCRLLDRQDLPYQLVRACRGPLTPDHPQVPDSCR
jgi:hypothetical protein